MTEHWSERPEGGGRFAIWLIRTIALRCGRPCARAFLYPATVYFFLRRGYERRVSYAFLERAGFREPQVQYLGSSRQAAIRLPPQTSASRSGHQP